MVYLKTNVLIIMYLRYIFTYLRQTSIVLFCNYIFAYVIVSLYQVNIGF